MPMVCHSVPMTRHIEPDAAVIRAVLAEEGSITRAAVRLGVSRRTLHRWIKRLGIEVERRLIAA